MSPMTRLMAGSFGAAALVAAGCGGSQGDGGNGGGQAHVTKSGNAVITYFGQPKPQLTTSTGAVSVFGQAGATFSSVTLEPAANLADTYLAFGRTTSAGETAVFEVPYSGSTASVLYENSEPNEHPTISAYGTIAFEESSKLFTVRPDGSGLRSIMFSGVPFYHYPSYAADGTNRLGFIGAASDSFLVAIGPGTGGSATILQTPSSAGMSIVNWGIGWSPTGKQIAFETGQEVGGSDVDTIWSASTTTPLAAPTNITPSPLSYTGIWSSPCWSPDGVTVASTYTAPSALSQVIKFNINTGDYYVLTPSSYSDQNASFSPDGSKIAFYRSSAGGATPGIYVMDTVGENATLLAADPTGSISNVGLAWSPFLPKETVVATSGSTFFHQSASGFLESQVGSQFGSLVAFTATTPSAAAIQAPSSSTGTAPLQFSLTADSITSIGYINNYFSPGTTISLSSTPSVLVSIDGVTGQVDLVAPASAKPSFVRNADGTVSYRASFKALYDGHGKNLAPTGASLVTVDSKSGQVVMWG